MKEKFLGVMLMLVMVISLASILPASTALADEDSASLETSSEVVEPSSVSPLPTQTLPTPTSGSCGDNVNWSFDTITGVLTISGMGKMNSYHYEAWDYCGDFLYPPPWNSFNVKSVIIQNGVKSVGDWALFDRQTLTSATIPKTVAEIGKYALGYYLEIDYEHYDYHFTKLSNFKVFCYAGTAGEKYAKDNGFEYEILPDITPNTTNKSNTKASKTKTAVKPAKVTKVRLTDKKKKLNVSWKKVSGATGYEVKAATNSKFTKGKKTVTVKKNKVTIKNLKPKKKYFVKVRAYKLANGRKYYGKWSKVVKKKTK